MVALYTVAKINNKYWMTQNLRITGTISAADSNFTGSSINTSAGGDLNSGDAGDETTLRSHRATSSDASNTSGASGGPYTIDQLGAWYNFCAASAGQVCSDAINQNATQDICPSGWRLPNNTGHYIMCI